MRYASIMPCRKTIIGPGQAHCADLIGNLAQARRIMCRFAVERDDVRFFVAKQRFVGRHLMRQYLASGIGRIQSLARARGDAQAHGRRARRDIEDKEWNTERARQSLKQPALHALQASRIRAAGRRRP